MRLRVNRKLKRTDRPMNQSTSGARPDEVREETTDAPPSVESVALLRGRRELIIRHGVDTYRLRITASNKLILTK